MIRHQKFKATASGDTLIVPVIANKTLTICAVFFVVSGPVEITFKSSATSVICLMEDGTFSAGAVIPHNPLGWAILPSGEGLTIELSTGVTVTGVIVYEDR